MDVLQGRRRDVGARRRGRAFTAGLIVAAVALAVVPASALAALETTITGGPSGLTNNPTPTFSFTSPDPNTATFECAVDLDPFAACSGTGEHTTQQLSDGAHTFRVQAKDAVGNVGSQATRDFTVDTVPPETTLESGPTGATNTPTPTFTFNSPGSPFASFECAVDADSFASCSGPKEHTTSSLGDGPHTFQVRAIDVAGNVDASPISVAFTVDTVPPETTIDSGPSGANNAPTFTFSAPGDSSATFECRVDTGSFAPCPSPFTSAPLSDGQHTLEVVATDAAGNVDTSPAILPFTVDTSAPETTIDSGPSGTTSDNTPEFFFSSDDPAATFECRMDADAFAPCTSPFATAPLSDGGHAFEVRATDAAGNVELSPARIAFTVDTSSPSSGPGPSVSTSVAPARVATSFVLIAKRTIRVSRRRLARVTLNCAGAKDCAGTVTLTTARRVRLARASARAETARKRSRRGHRRARRRVKLGSTSFEIPARVTTKVRVRLSRSRYRLVRKLGRVRVTVTVTDKDGAGRPRIGTREIILRAR